MEEVASIIVIGFLAFVQNTSFSIVSRARNRDSMAYHATASVFSNLIWFLTFRHLILEDMSWVLLPGYVFGTVCGSLFGAKVSMWIEQKLIATTDGHITEAKALASTLADEDVPSRADFDGAKR